MKFIRMNNVPDVVEEEAALPREYIPPFEAEIMGKRYSVFQGNTLSAIEYEGTIGLVAGMHCPVHHGQAIMVLMEPAHARSLAAQLVKNAEELEAAAATAAEQLLHRARDNRP